LSSLAVGIFLVLLSLMKQFTNVMFRVKIL
jgi:hypothetical protein